MASRRSGNFMQKLSKAAMRCMITEMRKTPSIVSVKAYGREAKARTCGESLVSRCSRNSSACVSTQNKVLHSTKGRCGRKPRIRKLPCGSQSEQTVRAINSRCHLKIWLLVGKSC
eukprot:6180564-Pleurochrysis_carterae.AAC.1